MAKVTNVLQEKENIAANMEKVSLKVSIFGHSELLESILMM